MNNSITLGERLIDLANQLYSQPGIVACYNEDLPDGVEHETIIARIKLAIDFKRRGNTFILRAIVENWDRERIIRELY